MNAVKHGKIVHGYNHARPLGSAVWQGVMALAAIGLSAEPALSQTVQQPEASAQPTAPAGAQPGDQLEEIVVTAQKRYENLQRVPIAVTAVQAATLTKFSLEGSQAIQQVTPGLVFGRNTFAGSPFLRGVGQLNSNPGVEPPVATYVDGVYVPGSQSNVFSLNNIARVEVLKGPQGTLFGRNTTGGVVNIVTRDPAFGSPAHVDADAGYGNYDAVRMRGYFGAGLGDDAAADVSAVFSRHDGYGTNRTTGNDARQEREFSIRSKLLWRPGENTSVRLVGNYLDLRQGTIGFALLPGVTGLGGVSNPGYYDTLGRDAFVRVKGYGTSLRIAQTFDWAELSNIVAYQHSDVYQENDVDSTAANFQSINYGFTDRTVTNELQLSSVNGAPVGWIVGLFYYNNVTNQDAFTILGTFSPASPFSTFARQKIEAYAPFAQVTVPVTAGLRITGGIRYNHDEIDVNGSQTAGNGAVLITPGSQEKSFAKFTYRAAIDIDLAAHVLAYASFNRGYKAGAFNLQLPNRPALRPEVLDAYEIGVKSEFLDRKIRLNASVFYYDYQEIVVRGVAIDPITNVLTARLINAAASTIKGIDADLSLIPVRNLTITAGIEYLDAKYDDFPGAPGSTSGSFPKTAIVINAKGKRLNLSPKFSFNLGAVQIVETSLGELSLAANYSYKSTYYFEPVNRVPQKGFGLLSGSIGLQLPGDRWNVKLYGQNLTGEKYFQNFQDLPLGDVYIPGSPRTYGISVGISL